MNQRQITILELLNQSDKLSVEELAQSLDTSAVTIRKDLDLLAGRGLLYRERGYALLYKSNDVSGRLSVNFEMKKKIAEKASSFVMDGETVMMESGSCCVLLAQELASQKRGITIITNSLLIASSIGGCSGTKVILLGGEYQPEAQASVGPMTKLCVSQFHVDKVFLGTDGFSPGRGFTGDNLLRTETLQEMAAHGEKKYILAESLKLKHQGVVTLLPLEQTSALITDSHITKEQKALFTKNNIKVFSAT